MDLADKAADAEHMARAAALSQRKPVLPRIGLCHYCGGEISAGVLHQYCIADYEREQKMQAINGNE
jgi:hypothetical protein